ncbi:ATP-binding protein [Streptomyces genisteinicus]|uniref:ATP-binding protein n=1 Tax=Streptomyces genisteinicus TaxID=2768068 RepID=A0A7H0HZ98_9ACTN|nr:ATP-binding protein [Streptomyces genisteinicus]QNP65864.1 ATP-binding protein [Streptomyces genisteinicus]
MSNHAPPATDGGTVTERVFRQRFSPTPRGARLARRLAVIQCERWGFGHDSELARSVALIVGELAANAVTHGRVPGRDVELVLARDPGAAVLRIEMSDARGESRPPERPPVPGPLAESGRGLLLVDALADRWEVVDRVPVGKTVRAELDLPGGPERDSARGPAD